MAKIISYSQFGEPITQQQMELLESYEINYIENDLLKKIEHHLKGTILFTYYLDTYEDISEVISRYNDSEIEIIKRINAGDYKIEESSLYSKGVLKRVFKSLYDQHNDEVCSQEYDIQALFPLLNKTEKYFYTEPAGVLDLGIQYDENGMIFSVWGDFVGNTDQTNNGVIYGDQFDFYFPDFLNDHPYYANADLVP